MKKLILAVVILLVIAAGAYLYFRQNKLRDFEPLIRAKLSQVVTDASNGLYSLKMDRIDIDVTRAKVTLINAHLVPDTILYRQWVSENRGPSDIFDISLASLVINDFQPKDFLANKAIKLRRLYIDGPQIMVRHRKSDKDAPQLDSAIDLYSRIKKDISSIEIDTLLLKNVDFHYVNTSTKKQADFKDVNFVITGIRIDSTAKNDRNRLLFAEDCRINLKDYSYLSANGLYAVKAKEINLQTSLERMEVDDLNYQPVVTRQQLYRKMGHQTDIFTINMKRVGFSKVKWWALLGEEAFISETIAIHNGSIKIFNDRGVPEDTRSKNGGFPHQLLLNVPFDLQVDKIDVKNVDVAYEELNPKSNKSGTVLFANASGTITNVTNRKDKIAANRFMIVNTSSQFMNRSTLTANFKFDLAQAKAGVFSVTAHLNKFPGAELNSITEPLALVKMNSLDIIGLDATVEGSEKRATGKIKLLYDNLNISALKPSKDNAFRKRAVLSFIANTFVLKKQNLEGKKVRIERATLSRNDKRSFFNLIWKTILNGAAKTVGYKVPE